jgi:hypothetical protein
MVKPPLRTKSIGFKVSEEEYARLETVARRYLCGASGYEFQQIRELVLNRADLLHGGRRPLSPHQIRHEITQKSSKIVPLGAPLPIPVLLGLRCFYTNYYYAASWG